MKANGVISTRGKIIASIIYLFLIVLNFLRIDSTSHSASDTLRPFMLQCIALALLFFVIYLVLSRKKQA